MIGEIVKVLGQQRVKGRWEGGIFGFAAEITSNHINSEKGNVMF